MARFTTFSSVSSNSQHCSFKTSLAYKLIKARADLDIHEKEEGQTPLIRAARDGHQEIVRKLVTAKASLDIRDNTHNTALMYAAAIGYRESVHTLIEGKANIDNQGHHNATALIFAINWIITKLHRI